MESTKLLIVTEWRSGSTMLEMMLSYISNSFHIHEPLAFNSENRITSPDDNNYEMFMNLLESLFNCDFSILKGKETGAPRARGQRGQLTPLTF